MDVGYWRSSRDALQADYLAPSCYLIHRAGALRLKPDVQLPCRYSVHGRASDDAIHRDAREAMAANPATPSSADILRWIAGLVYVIVLTVLHGCTDRFAVTILLGAIVLSVVFSKEAKRNGRLVLGTYLTHAAANTMVFSLQLL